MLKSELIPLEGPLSFQEEWYKDPQDYWDGINIITTKPTEKFPQGLSVASFLIEEDENTAYIVFRHWIITDSDGTLKYELMISSS